MAGMAQMMTKDGFKPMGFVQMAGKRDPDTNKPLLAQGLVEAAMPSDQPRRGTRPIVAPIAPEAPTIAGGDASYG